MQGPRMLTVLGLPVVGLVPSFATQDLNDLPGTDADELQGLKFMADDDDHLHPLLATVMHDTREGSVDDCMKRLKSELHSHVLIPQVTEAFLPAWIPSRTEPATDSPEATIWVPQTADQDDVIQQQAHHDVAFAKPADPTGIKGVFHAALVAFLPEK